MIQEFSEQELIRRESLAKLRELGIEPYPAALYPVNTTAKQIIKTVFHVFTFLVFPLLIAPIIKLQSPNAAAPISIIIAPSKLQK